MRMTFVLAEDQILALGQIFLLVDLRDFSDLGSGGREKKKKKSSENAQLTGHFQGFFSFSELFFFLISQEQTVKLVK